MLFLKWIVIALAAMNFGFMFVDGMRALIKGDYIRPKSGKYAGQLGPWSHLVQRINIDPESTLMKTIFVFWGLAGLSLTSFFALDFAWSWEAMLIVNIATLWYLIPGTALGLVSIALLLISHPGIIPNLLAILDESCLALPLSPS